MCTVMYGVVKCVLHRGYLLEYVREYIVTSSYYLYCIQTSKSDLRYVLDWCVWINGCVLVHLFNYFHHTIKLVRSNTIDCLRLSNICLSSKENNPQPQRHALWWQQVVLFSCLPHSQKLEGWPQPHRQPMDSLNGNGVDAVGSRWDSLWFSQRVGCRKTHRWIPTSLPIFNHNQSTKGILCSFNEYFWKGFII